MSSKDVETAKQLLAKVSFEDMPNFLSYALGEAQKTKFDVQTLGGLRQYLASYGETRDGRAAQKAEWAARAAKQREEEAYAAYAGYRRAAAEALFATLPAAEQAVIDGLARGEPRQFGRAEGPLAQHSSNWPGPPHRRAPSRTKSPAYEAWQNKRTAA